LKEIADELNAQTIKPAETPAEIAPNPVSEPAPEPTPEPIVESVEAPVEKEWWDSETKIESKNEPQVQEKPTFDMDDDLKLILEYKKSGKTLADFVKEYQVEDVNTWDEATLVKNGMKEFMNLSDEELEQATYEYESASIIQKKQWAETFKQRFAEKNEQKLKQLVSSNTAKQRDARSYCSKIQ